MTSAFVEGGCLCRAVRYRVTGKALAQSLCHCRTCRLASAARPWHGSSFRGDFVFIAGRPTTFRSAPEVVRAFCDRCGTPLTYRHGASPDTVDVTTVSLDDPERFAPTREVWLEHRLAWKPLNAALVHYSRSSDERIAD
jgi:hypothetical protein